MTMKETERLQVSFIVSCTQGHSALKNCKFGWRYQIRTLFSFCTLASYFLKYDIRNNLHGGHHHSCCFALHLFVGLPIFVCWCNALVVGLLSMFC